jgi:hypothetical protein
MSLMTDLLINAAGIAAYLGVMAWSLRLSHARGNYDEQLPKLQRAARLPLWAFAVSMALLMLTAATEDTLMAAIWLANLAVAARFIRTMRRIRDTHERTVAVQRSALLALRTIEARHAARQQRTASDTI